MENLYMSIIGFILCSGVIIFSGSKLSYYGDQISELTGLGKAWVGLILMASVTSLPELITGISSVAIVDAPNLAAGDIFGSCIFNLLVLSLLDSRLKQPLLSMVKTSHIVAAICGIILTTIAGLSIFIADGVPTLLWISSFTFLIFAIYFLTMWLIFKNEQSELLAIPKEEITTIKTQSTELKKVIGGYALHALIVIGAALFLPYFGEHIAEKSGFGNSFFGTLFLAAATSLPELVVSLAALRMGALDMAVGNLLGSNVFNIFILGIDDVFYSEGSLFKNISPSHLLSVFIIIIMTAVVSLGLFFRPKRKHLWILNLDTFIIVVLYVSLISYLYINK